MCLVFFDPVVNHVQDALQVSPGLPTRWKAPRSADHQPAVRPFPPTQYATAHRHPVVLSVTTRICASRPADGSAIGRRDLPGCPPARRHPANPVVPRRVESAPRCGPGHRPSPAPTVNQRSPCDEAGGWEQPFSGPFVPRASRRPAAWAVTPSFLIQRAAFTSMRK